MTNYHATQHGRIILQIEAGSIWEAIEKLDAVMPLRPAVCRIHPDGAIDVAARGIHLTLTPEANPVQP